METSLHSHDDHPTPPLNIKPSPLPSTDAQFHTKDRALLLNLLEFSSLIDVEDAIQQRSKNVFSGWEPVCDIFVSRDDPLLVVIAVKDKRVAKRREINYKGGDLSSSSSDSDTDITPESPTITIDKAEQRDKKKITIKRPSSTSHTSLPQLPSPTPSPPSTSPHSTSGNKKSEDDGKKDFLPKIEPKRSSSYKKVTKSNTYFRI
jgi:hypothetical protein